MQNEIKKVLNDKQITIQYLINSTGISRTTIYQILNNKCNTGLEYAMRISKVLNVPIQELFFCEDSVRSYSKKAKQ